MVINGRVHVLLEFMCSYPWHQPGGTNGADRKEAGWGLGHRCLTGWFALAECSDHVPVGGYVSTSRKCCGGSGGVFGGGIGGRGGFVGFLALFFGSSFSPGVLKKGGFFFFWGG